MSVATLSADFYASDLYRLLRSKPARRSRSVANFETDLGQPAAEIGPTLLSLYTAKYCESGTAEEHVHDP